MQGELYFDISTEKSGGSLYRVQDEAGKESFQYHHSTYDDDRDEIKVFQTAYATFAQFWQTLTKDPQWFYQHAMFVHNEQRAFVKAELAKVNWDVQPNKKWQESHQRQWRKVLTGTNDYYRSKL